MELSSTTNDVNVVLTSVRRHADLPQVPRARQPGAGARQPGDGASQGIMEVYQGPFPGSVRRPEPPVSTSR